MKLSLLALSLMVPLSFSPAMGEEAKTNPITTSHLVGPGVAGFCMSMAIHPADPNVAITGVDMGLFFVTYDGGKSWEPVGPVQGSGNYSPGSASANAIAFHPTDTKTFWLGSAGIFKTEDGGKTTRFIHNTGDYHVGFSSLVLDPSSPDILYAGEGGPVALDWEGNSRKGRIYKTVDGGKEWKTLNLPAGLDEAGAKWTTLLVDPTSAIREGEGHERVYAIGDRRIYRSDDAGASWISLDDTQPGSAQQLRLAVNLAIVVEDGKPVLFGSFSGEKWRGAQTVMGGIFRSDDHGKTWSARNKGLEEAIGNLTYHAPRPYGIQRNIVLLAHSSAAPKRLYSAILGDVYRSDDLGGSWEQVVHKPMEFIPDSKDGKMEGWFLPSEKGNIRNQLFDERIVNGRFWSSMYLSMLSVAQTDADRVMFSPQGMITRDGGKTWDVSLFEYAKAVKPNRFGERPPNRYTHSVRSTGAQVIVPTDISFDPFDPEGLAATFMDVGAFVSRDRGDSWMLSWDGILQPQGDILNQAGQVLFDSETKDRLWVVQATHGKGYKYGQHLYRSDDGGLNFTEIPVTPLISEDPKSYVIDLIVERGSGALMTMTSKGLLRSEDGGKSWVNRARDSDRAIFELPEGRLRRLVRPRSLFQSPADPQTYFFRREMDKVTPPGLFRSRDGGVSWSELGKGRFGAASAIGLSKSNADLLYVAAASPKANGSHYGVYETPLWRSRNGGDDWESVQIPKEYSLVISVIVHPEDENLLYVLCGSRRHTNPYQSALVRSKDGGKTWELVDPSLSLSVKTFGCNGAVFDPNDARRIYLMTDCGAWQVWDANGKP